MLETATKTIKIDDIDSSTIERTLEFIYSGVFNAPPDDALVNLLYCPENYDLQQLKSVCLLHMTSTVDLDGEINFTSSAVKCGAKAEAQEKLFDYCKGYAMLLIEKIRIVMVLLLLPNLFLCAQECCQTFQEA